MNSIKFYLAQGASAAVAFLAIPILTRIYAPDVYGQYLLILSAVTFINTVFTYGLYQSTLRFVPGAATPAEVEQQVENGTLIILLTVAGFTAAGLAVLGGPMGGIAGGGIVGDAFVTVLLTGAWTVLLVLATLQSVLRYTQGHAGRYALYMLAQNGLPPLLALALSFVFGTTLTVLLLGQMLAIGVAWATVAKPVRFTRPHWHLLEKFVRYGAPLTLWILCAQLLNSLDRFMIARLVSLDAAGVYATNYNLIVSVQSLAFGPLLLAVHPQLMRLWNQQDPAYQHVLQEAVALFGLLAALALGFFWACHSGIATWLLGTEFRAASPLMPLISLGHILWGLAAYLGKGFEFRRQTARMARFALIAVVVNAGLNWLALPRFGMTAAAGTTLAAYALYTVLVYGFAEAETRRVLHHPQLLLTAAIPLAMWSVRGAVETQLHRSPVEAVIYAVATGGSLALALLLSRAERRAQVRMLYARAVRLPGLTQMAALLVALVGLLLPAASSRASAAPALDGAPPVANIEQFDLDGDARPDLTVLHTEILFPTDQVRIYDGGDNMGVSVDWREATDFWDDTWVFDMKGDGNAQFVAQFMPVANGFAMHLFMDQNGNGVVSIEVDGEGRVRVTESPAPPLIVTVQGDWYLPDGQLNWNVQFQVDGPIRHIYTYNLTEVWHQRDYFRLDGSADTELKFADADADGVPEMGIWRVLAPTPASRGSMRTWIWSNEGRHPPEQPDDFVFFPYFSANNFEDTVVNGRASVSGRNYFDTPPLVSMAFDSARIRYLYFPGYPIEEGYHVHSLNYFRDDVVNYANFENEQAYYDLAEDRDGIPELHIRHRYYDAGDPYGWSLDTPVDEIRWSWNQDNVDELAWTHKVSLAGRHEITTTVQLGDVAYGTVPYAELPDWVMERPWDYGLFVASETFPLRSTEGIYEWNAVEQVHGEDASSLSRYLAGDVTLDPADAFTELSPGWRGDVAPRLNGVPTLYLSALDGKLHLRQATRGLWNLDERNQLHYADEDGDGYFDSWQLFTDGELKQQLHLAAGQLLFADGGRMRIQPYDGPLAHVEALPPRTDGERRALSEQLVAHQPASSFLTPEEIFAQFTNAVTEVEGAALQSFRSEPGGFYGTLVVESEPDVSGTDRLGVAGAAPGQYSMRYDRQSGAFALEPARLSLTLDAQLPPPDGITQRVLLTVQNSGNQDAAVTLVAEAHQGTARVELWREPVSIEADGEARFMQRWQPPTASGAWLLDIRIEDEAGNPVAQTQHQLESATAESRLRIASLATSGLAHGIIYRTLWVALGLLIAAVLYLSLGPSARLDTPQPGAIRPDATRHNSFAKDASS